MIEPFPDYDPAHPLWWEDERLFCPPKPGKIPRVIHQLWIGPKRRPARLMQTWKDKHPDWEYVLWDEDGLKDFGFENQLQIDAMPEWNGKADIMRYEILHRHGGVFMDADSECLNPLDDFFLDNDSFAVLENESRRGALVACGIMGATKGCRLMKNCILDVRAGQPAWWYVGPVYFTWVIQSNMYTDITLYPSHWFIPNHYTGDKYDGPDKLYADHKWGTAMHLYGDLA